MAMTILRVSQLNRYVKSLLDSNELLREVYLRGELSNLSGSRAGHLYFTLKDADASVRSVMFSRSAEQLRFYPENGMSVIARGSATLYERDGAFQLMVSELMPDGEGALKAAFERMKNALSAEGLFDEGKKRPIPPYPSVVGVVTSPNGAAIRDIVSTLERRNPLVTVLLAPAVVQGNQAASSIAAAIAALNADRRSEVLIVGRGGGSAEELWAFNEEQTVRAVAASGIPVISAVGHETDLTLCDLAADLRAATPTAAAELAVQPVSSLAGRLEHLSAALRRTAAEQLASRQSRLGELAGCEALKNPFFLLDTNGQRLQHLIQSMYNLSENILSQKEHRLARQAALLEAYSPLKVLARGYSITERDGRPLLSCEDAAPGDEIVARLASGRLRCEVLEQIRGDCYEL